jgi:hypothetical protein
MMDGARASAISTVWPSTPGAPLLRTTFSSALARLASFATASSSRLASAPEASGPLVFLRLALCSRKLRRSDASGGSFFPPPEGLSANTRLNCRGPVLLNPSLPLLYRLSSASRGECRAFVRIATTERSDFCAGVVPSSSPPSGLPLDKRTRADLPG